MDSANGNRKRNANSA
jgi:hypothetical protein